MMVRQPGLKIAIVLALCSLGLLLIGCQDNQAAEGLQPGNNESEIKVRPESSAPGFSLQHSETRLLGEPGEILDFPLQILPDTPDINGFRFALASEGESTWNAALCFEDQCWLQQNNMPIDRNIRVRSDSPLEISIKIFIDADAIANQQKTVTLNISTLEKQAATRIVTLIATSR